MSDIKDSHLSQLESLGLSREHAVVYTELLKNPLTYLRLSRVTGFPRTNVYRLVEQLERRSLVSKITNDAGTFLEASDPATLEVEITAREEEIKHQRRTLQALLPGLRGLRAANDDPFIVRTYEGIAGLKQMVWHELKTQGEIVALGSSPIEDLIPNHDWVERFRARQAQAGYVTLDLVNEPEIRAFTDNDEFMKNYSCRWVPASTLFLDKQIVIYNNTVSIYHWRNARRAGIEIVNRNYARTMRQMFDMYWHMGTPIITKGVRQK